MLYISPIKALAVTWNATSAARWRVSARSLRLGGPAPAVKVGIAPATPPPAERRAVHPPAGHPDHHPGVAVPDAHLGKARDALTVIER